MNLTEALFDLSRTLAAPLLARFAYPWDALGEISDFVTALSQSLDESEYDNPAPGIYIARSARVAPSASITGPCIICADAEIRHNAFIRGSVLIGCGAVAGNSTELKNCILFDGVQAPHYNYIGDSILGHGAHFGAGAVTSNVKSDKTPVVVHLPDGDIATGRKKVGTMAGDFAEVGCNAVLCPGAVLGRDSTVYPGVVVRGTLGQGCIMKAPGVIVAKQGYAPRTQ